MVSNVSAVNVVNQDILINSDGLQVSVQNSINSPDKIRNKGSPGETSKHIPSTITKNTTDRTKKRTKNHCRALPFDECDVSVENRAILQGQQKKNREEKEIRSSIESVIKYQCDLPLSVTEDEPSNSRLSYISHKSSNLSSGRASRISYRSTSSASLPSSCSQNQHLHKKEQRRRISIQNEDVPHIRNKDVFSTQGKPVSSKAPVVQTAPQVNQIKAQTPFDDISHPEDNLKSDTTETKRLSTFSSRKPSTSSTSANAARKGGNVSVKGTSRNGGRRIEKKDKRKLKAKVVKNTPCPESLNSLPVYGRNETKYLKQLRTKQSQFKVAVNSISPEEEVDENEYEDMNSDTDSLFEHSSANSKNKPVKTSNTKGRSKRKIKIKSQTRSSKPKETSKKTLKIPLAVSVKKLFTPRKTRRAEDTRAPKTPFITPIASRIKSKLKRKCKDTHSNGNKPCNVENPSALTLTPSTSSLLTSYTSEPTKNVDIFITPIDENSNGTKTHSKKTKIASEQLQKGVHNKKLFKKAYTTKDINEADPQFQPMINASTSITMGTTVNHPKKKKCIAPASPSLAVTAVFAAKIAKSAKKVGKKDHLKSTKRTKGSISKKKTEVKLLPTPFQSTDRDVVTKYLKKFKEHVSPRKQATLNRLTNNVPTSSNKPLNIGGKGKGTGKKSTNVLQNTENSNIEGFNKVEDTPQSLAQMKKAKGKKGSKTSLEDDEVIFKKPTKPVSLYKQKIPKVSKTANNLENVASVNTNTSVKSTFKKIKNGVSKLRKSKPSEQKVLRSSHR